jgi:phosphoglucosamine mutase
MEMLLERGWILGGESSGHIICLDRTTTGDGIVSALQVLAAITTTGRSLGEIRSEMTKYPQRMINVPVSGKLDLGDSGPIRDGLRAAEASLNGRGRVLLRPSGTEPVVRVMVEGEDPALIEVVAESLAERVRELAGPGG